MLEKLRSPDRTVLALVAILILVAALIAYTLLRPAPRSASSLTTDQKLQDRTVMVPGVGVATYFGNEVAVDMNGDGLDDRAYLVTRNAEGSGRFYYVVAEFALKSGGHRSSEPAFLGDRIAPQTTEFRDGLLIVNYADRASGEPMTTKPSVGVSKYFKIKKGQLVAVER